MLTLIAALDRHRGIGVDNALPWNLPEDLAYFKRITQGHPIIMGRKTFDSLGKPLPGRKNIVVTRNHDWAAPGASAVGSLDAALRVADHDDVFVIGGAQLFNQSILLANRLLLTELDAVFPCDTFFPAVDPVCWAEFSRTTAYSDKLLCHYSFVDYRRRC